MLNRPVARELQTELEPELLRAVPLNLCMSGWAKHFVPPDPGMFKVDHSNYDLSRQTEYYDEFLSHDWETSRWYKLCTMLMIYNSRAAFFCSLVVSIAVGILRATKILPDGLWIQLSVFAVVPLVLCFWQRIRIMFARPLVVFLDKLCIAQHDEELKQKGIFGLAGFLDHSRQLTIFWSHRYFSRLWCTYEVGTFLRAKKQKPILVIPVKLAVILCLFFVAELVIMVGYFMLSNLKLESTVNDVEELFSFFLLFSLFYMPCLPLLFYLGIGMMSDLKELPQQLRKFRVQDAKCFCCSHKHRHPDTGEVLPCDRELMFQMLQKWFGKAGDLKEEHLEVFNRLVHEDLAPRVLRSVGSDALPFNYSIYMVVVNTLPGLCTLIPTLVAGPPDSFNRFNILQHSIWASREIMNWLFAGVVVLYALRLSMRGWLIAVTLLPHCPRHNRVICSILMPVLMSVMLATQWFSFQLALSHSEQNSLFPAIPFIAWLLVLFCFWSWGAPSTSSTAGNSFAAEPPIFKEEVLSSIDVDGNNRKTDDDSASTFST